MLVGGGLESMWQIRRASSLRPTPMVCIGRSHLGLSVDPSIRLEKGEEKKGDAELNLIKVDLVDMFKAWVSKIWKVVVKTKLSLQLLIAFWISVQNVVTKLH